MTLLAFEVWLVGERYCSTRWRRCGMILLERRRRKCVGRRRDEIYGMGIARSFLKLGPVDELASLEFGPTFGVYGGYPLHSAHVTSVARP